MGNIASAIAVLNNILRLDASSAGTELYHGRGRSSISEAQRVRLIEMAAAHARSSEWRVAALGYVVEFHLQAGDGERARREAEEMLRRAPDMYAESSRTYASHIAHTVLGRTALRQGQLAEAREELRAAGKVASADVVRLNGIRWTLASDLLARGERDVVLDYISMVRIVWNKSKSQLDDWAKSIRAGEIVDFGATTIDPAPRLIGNLAPDFRLRSVDGQQVALSSYKGKLVLLDFGRPGASPAALSCRFSRSCITSSQARVPLS